MALCSFGARQFGSAVLVLASLTGGCSNEDAERMARVGHKLAARAEALSADQADDFSKGWQIVRTSWRETTLAGRVAARLRWDKKLADCQIQALTSGSNVELKGTVRDAEQRRRAIDLAEATTGADKVTDSLEVAAP